MWRQVVISAILTASGYVTAVGQIRVSSPLVQHFQLDSASHAIGQIDIVNDGPEPVLVKLQVLDYVFGPSGQGRFEAGGTHDRSFYDGITLATDYVQVAPRSMRPAFYRIGATPRHVTEGSYWSVIVVSPVSEPTEAAPTGSRLVARTIMQYAIQIVAARGQRMYEATPEVVIPGAEVLRRATDGPSSRPDPGGGSTDGLIPISFDDITEIELDQTKQLLIRLHNDASFLLEPMVWTIWYDGTDQVVGSSPARSIRIYPSYTTNVRFEVPAPAHHCAYFVVMVSEVDDIQTGTRRACASLERRSG